MSIHRSRGRLSSRSVRCVLFACAAVLAVSACEGEQHANLALDAGVQQNTSDAGSMTGNDAGFMPGSDAGGPADSSSPPSDAGSNIDRLFWTPCGDAGASCTQLVVPLDYEQPAARAVVLRMVRFAATVPDQKIGTLLVDGVGAAEVSRLYYRAQERFDIIEVDRRGTGRSEPALDCATEQMRERLRAADPYLDLAEYRSASQAIADECRARFGDDVVSHMGTLEAARDLDRVRAALEEQTISFLGVSQGAWLGAVYATLHPRRVRAMVLDSIPKPSWDLSAHLSERSEATDRQFERFLSWCEKTPALCDFHGGQSVDQIRSAWDGLIAQLAAQGGIAVLDRNFTSLDMRYLSSRLLSGPSYETLGSLLASVEAGDAFDALAAADRAHGSRHDAELVIACNDYFGPEKASAEKLELALERLSSSRFALEHYARYESCEGWPGPDAPLPIDAATAPPFYLLNGENDPVTPERWAEEMEDALGNGSFYQLIDQPGHRMYDRVPAVTRIENYLIDPALEPGPFSCIDQPPIAHTSTTAIRVDGQVNIYSAMARTATVPVTVELYEEDTHLLLATVTATLSNGRFPSMLLPVGAERPWSIYIRATAEGLISGEHHFRAPLVKNAFISVNLADTSMFERIFASSSTPYDPSLSAMRVYATDCDRRHLAAASVSEDSPSGFIWYGESRDNTCVYGVSTAQTDGVCEPMGVNFSTGEVTLAVSKEDSRFVRRVMIRPRTFVQYDVGP